MFEQLDELLGRYEEMTRQLQDPAIAGDGAKFQKIMKEQGSITPLVNAYTEYKKCNEDLSDALEMLSSESDEEMRAMLKETVSEDKKRIAELEEEIKILLLPKDPNDSRNVILEIRAGAGGDEAALFAAELCGEPGLESPACGSR